MSDLAEFLLARIADDERKIGAMTSERNRVETAPAFADRDLGWLTGIDIFVSPDRWRAECEAKRSIIAWVTDKTVICEVADPVLVALALPYADHPLYDESWRP